MEFWNESRQLAPSQSAPSDPFWRERSTRNNTQSTCSDGFNGAKAPLHRSIWSGAGRYCAMCTNHYTAQAMCCSQQRHVGACALDVMFERPAVRGLSSKVPVLVRDCVRRHFPVTTSHARVDDRVGDVHPALPYLPHTTSGDPNHFRRYSVVENRHIACEQAGIDFVS